MKSGCGRKFSRALHTRLAISIALPTLKMLPTPLMGVIQEWVLSRHPVLPLLSSLPTKILKVLCECYH